MPSLDLILFILRHVDSQETSMLWKSCFDSIRRFYPDTMIVILDNGSNLSFVDTLPPDQYSSILSSELPNGRLFVPYYYYLTYYSEYKRAIILHDSTILQNKLSIDTISTIKYLWHFETHQYDVKHIGHSILSALTNTTELHRLYDSNQWQGCLGCMSVITGSFLQNLQAKYSLLSLQKTINSKEYACEFERIFSVLCTYEEPDLYTNASLFGDISTLEWGLSYSKYISNIETYNKYTVVKLFAAR